MIGHVPLGEWKTITFVAGLRHKNRMTAPMVVDGPMTGEMFLAYVKQCLVPTLRRNDIVAWTTSEPTGPRIREAIEKARATVRYLPKYSPDLNPIEMPYSKFKAFCASRRANRSAPLPNNSIVRATAQCSRMRELFQACRICCKMTGNRFLAGMENVLEKVGISAH